MGMLKAKQIKVGDILRTIEDGNTIDVIVSKIDVLVDKNQLIFYY